MMISSITAASLPVATVLRTLLEGVHLSPPISESSLSGGEAVAPQLYTLDLRALFEPPPPPTFAKEHCYDPDQGHADENLCMPSVRLDALLSGEYDAPAENTCVNIIHGPWPRGQKLFRRNIGEAVAVWCNKVLDDAKAEEVRSTEPAAAPQP